MDDARCGVAYLGILSAPPRKAPSYAERASRIGEQVRREDGVAAACDALEGLF